MRTKPFIVVCYSNEDKSKAKKLYESLKKENCNLWIDNENIFPGEKIISSKQQAIKRADIVLICLSHTTVNKGGFIHKEICWALDRQSETPENDILIIPVKLSKCELPDKLNHIQSVNMYEDYGFELLIKAIKNKLITLNQMKPFIQDKIIDFFINRERELEELTVSEYPYFLIHAPIGYGKTRLIKKIKEDMEKDNWFCVDIKLSQKKLHSLNELFPFIKNSIKNSNETFTSSSDTNQSDLIYLIKIQMTSKNTNKILFLIDKAECMSGAASYAFINNFIASLREDVENTVKGPFVFKLIFAAQRLNMWTNTSEIKKIPIKKTYLEPFGFYAVYRTVQNYSKKIISDNNINSIYLKSFATALMRYTGGHPGCMDEILTKYFLRSVPELDFKKNEYLDLLMPVIMNIKESIPEYLEEVFEAVTMVRMFDIAYLKTVIDNLKKRDVLIKDKLDKFKNVNNIIPMLTETRLIKENTYYKGDRVRRLLSSYLLFNKLEYYKEFNQIAINYYESILNQEAEENSFSPITAAVELIFQTLQYILADKKPSDQDLNKRIKLIISKLQSLENMSDHPNQFLQTFIDRIDEDQEIEYLNFYLFKSDIKENYLLKKVRHMTYE